MGGVFAGALLGAAAPAAAFTMAEQMAAGGVQATVAGAGARSAAPTIGAVKNRLSTGQRVKRDTPKNGRSKPRGGVVAAAASGGAGGGRSGWGGATQGWARAGAGGGWASSARGGWASQNGWANASSSWSGGGQGGWARPGGPSS